MPRRRRRHHRRRKHGFLFGFDEGRRVRGRFGRRRFGGGDRDDRGMARGGMRGGRR
jgi:hypothetical protein